MKCHLYRLRNWIIGWYLRIRYRQIIPERALPVDWIAVDLIISVAYDVLNLESLSIRSSGLSFEIPEKAFPKDLGRAHELLQAKYKKLYPLIRAYLLDLFHVPCSLPGSVGQTQIRFFNKELTIKAVFDEKNIDMTVVQVTPIEIQGIPDV